ncbi:serine/threonine protein kinase [Roseospira navarrensis]|uniref:Serine/threonine protein kinase n=1 Tax=Roseospira navarrensis TaxID=140058 RepID=A0A7X1ZGY1_9PROT|nr:serine/threonine protein kinase [Roseospira navarrensis]
MRVESWTEWDPLRHVIVGRADLGQVPAPEPAVNAKVPEHSDMRGRWGRRPQDSIDRANALLDDFAALLRRRGIVVDRPEPIDFDAGIQTPDFQARTQFGCMAPRDVLLTVGPEIVEATMSFRCRWFEYLAYRPLLTRYFEADPAFRHTAAPKPRLTDRSFRPGYLDDAIGVQTRLDWTARKVFVTTEEEILFDAADVIRLGRDLIVQHGFTTNRKGIAWLRRHFPDHRVHAAHFPGDPYPAHIDCTLVPLCPGLILSNPTRPLPEHLRSLFRTNDWQVVEAAPPAHAEPPPLCYSSVWLSMNVLMLDARTVCVEKTEVHQAEQLDRLGFEVVPVALRDAYPFGGGLHCCTADVYRAGDRTDYLPRP